MLAAIITHVALPIGILTWIGLKLAIWADKDHTRFAQNSKITILPAEFDKPLADLVATSTISISGVLVPVASK